MLVANARFAGMTAAALSAARDAAAAPAGVQPTPGGSFACVDCAGPGSPEEILTLVRFGRWGDVVAIPVPSDFGVPRLIAYNKASFYYARALALFALGLGESADEVSVGPGDSFPRLRLGLG